MDYKYFGVMLDCSRNAVMKPEKIKFFIDCLQKMGYNALELYTEDTYEVENEPNFGYMRGRYSGEEIREIDAYAKAHGVELIPCVQTLAHFTAFTKTEEYKKILDCNDILLIDEPRTYELIENIFKTLAKNFSSRNVNIGMDEAHMVGRGKYLDLHGLIDRSELLVKHLKKVAEIAQKYGFKPHMWSDMFFRLVNNGVYFSTDADISDEIKKKVPDNVALCYWDYYHTEKDFYDKMFARHKEFNREIWFAGGAWTWDGFAPLTGFTDITMKPAMQSVKDNEIQNVLITLWGDNGAECSVFSQLHSLYAIRRYADGETDEKSIADGFYKLFGVKFADFKLLDLPNCKNLNDNKTDRNSCCKPFLFCDPFMGVFDLLIERRGNVPYAEFAKTLKDAGARAGDFKYLFQELASLCSVLELKATLGVKTRKAYSSGDKAALKRLIPLYEKTAERVKKFHAEFYALWHEENKSQGWEVQDLRLGGLVQRLYTCQKRLKDYLAGKIAKIEELEEVLLDGFTGDDLTYNSHAQIFSKSID